MEDIWLSHLVKRVIADCEMALVSVQTLTFFSQSFHNVYTICVCFCLSSTSMTCLHLSFLLMEEYFKWNMP